MVGSGAARVIIGSGWGLLPLPVVGPAIAAALGGVVYTLAAGGVAMAECLLFAFDMDPADQRPAVVALLAAAGITAVGVLACQVRARRDRELAEVSLVAEATQQVLLRPVPRQAGPVTMAVRYLSASARARVGGDLYEVVATPERVRLIVGDAAGKGLPAVQSAATVLGVFREAAHDEDSLAQIAARIEASLARELRDEQFVTAVLADMAVGGAKVELLNCGHPAPLLLSLPGPRAVVFGEHSLPLGLGQLTGAPRLPVTIPFGPGESLLFYTDGASEARNRAGTFFPLAECVTENSTQHPGTVVERLGDAIIRHIGHAPDDDVAMLVVRRDDA